MLLTVTVTLTEDEEEREFRLLQSEFCRLGCPNDPEGEANELLARLSLLKGLGLTMRNYQPAQILKEGASFRQVVVEIPLLLPRTPSRLDKRELAFLWFGGLKGGYLKTLENSAGAGERPKGRT